MEAAREGVQAMLDGRFPGKVVIFPQISGLPLIGVAELAEKYPEIAARLDPSGAWTADAERALIERFWSP